MKQVLQLRLHLCSDTIFGSGASIPGGEDIALRTDSAGYPLLAGSTLKGLLRESVTDLLCWTDGDSTLPGLLFGSEGWTGEDSRRVIFSDLRLENPPADPEACTALRTFTALENGIVKEGTLRVASCLRGGLTFTGVLLCEEQDVPLLCHAFHQMGGTSAPPRLWPCHPCRRAGKGFACPSPGVSRLSAALSSASGHAAECALA